MTKRETAKPALINLDGATPDKDSRRGFALLRQTPTHGPTPPWTRIGVKCDG
jgi:hypothetical protein